MDIPRADIDYAKDYCANFGQRYRGPNVLNTGFTLEEPEERAAAIEHSWANWSAYTRNYFMAMLHTLGGHKTLGLLNEITNLCTPEEALGGRAAIDVFWKFDLALRGPSERRGGWSFTHVQFAILADEEVNAEVYTAVERSMELSIVNTLRTRRNMMRQLDDGEDHDAGLEEDSAYFFGRGRPMRLSRKQRNENYDFVLF